MKDRALNEQALLHATFLRRYLLRQGSEFASTPDENGIFDAILFLELIADDRTTINVGGNASGQIRERADP